MLSLVDPQRIAEDIISMRSEAAKEEDRYDDPGRTHGYGKPCIPSTWEGMIHNQDGKAAPGDWRRLVYSLMELRVRPVRRAIP
jgi:hypothetical protein